MAKQSLDGEEGSGNVGEDPAWNYENKAKPFSDLNVKEIHSNDVGRDIEWVEVEVFNNPEDFQQSELCAEINNTMIANRKSRSATDRIQQYR